MCYWFEKNEFEIFLRAFWEENIPLEYHLRIGKFKQQWRDYFIELRRFVLSYTECLNDLRPIVGIRYQFFTNTSVFGRNIPKFSKVSVVFSF